MDNNRYVPTPEGVVKTVCLLCKGVNMKKWRWSLAVALVLGAVLLGSCLDFFTNPIGGDALARDPGTIEVSAGNVNALLKESRGDSKASKGILDKIATELANPSLSAKDKSALQAAAVTAANQAAGLGELVLGSIDILLDATTGDGGDEDTLNTLLDKIQGTAKENDLKGISERVTESLSGAVATDGVPVLTGDFADNLSAGDLTLLAFTLILGEVEEKGGTFESYIKSWGDDKRLDGTGTVTLSASETLIAAIGNKLADGDSEIGTMLKDLLGGK
ncbi:MAG: hypothetical protein LBU00_00290 [Treponema sp.]|nr:hypothetical protein [Treponema sp.]